MSDTAVKVCKCGAPGDPLCWRGYKCRKCYRAYMRAYMAKRCGYRRRNASWAGIEVSCKIRQYVYAEARARGVTVQSIVDEWRSHGV